MAKEAFQIQDCRREKIEQLGVLENIAQEPEIFVSQRNGLTIVVWKLDKTTRTV